MTDATFWEETAATPEGCMWNSAKNRSSTAFSNTKTGLPCRVSTVKLTTALTNCIRITDLSNKQNRKQKLKLLWACGSKLLRLQLEGGKGPRARTEPVPPRLPWSQRRKTQHQQSMFVQLTPHVTSICQTNVWHSWCSVNWRGQSTVTSSTVHHPKNHPCPLHTLLGFLGKDGTPNDDSVRHQ